MVDWRRGFQGPQRKRPLSRRAAARRIQGRYRARRVNSSLAKAVKRISLASCETKKSSQYTDVPQRLYHNVAYYAGELLATTQGITDPNGADEATLNRIGDEVIGRNIAIKFFIANVHDRPNIMYRLVVFKYNTLAISTPGLSDVYFWNGLDGAGANMNRMLDSANRERVSVVKSMWIHPAREANYTSNNAGAWMGHEKTHMLHVNIPLKNRKIKYNADGGTNTKFTDYGFMLVAYDTFSTLQTDLIANCQWTSAFTYKDP